MQRLSNQKINYVLIFDNDRKVVWSSGFDLVNKENIPVEPDTITFFKDNGLEMLNHKENYYSVIKRQYGASGFLQLSNNRVGYFSNNFIKDSNDTKPVLGYMVFGRILTPEYLKQLSDDLGYPISLIPLAKMEQNAEDQKILGQLTYRWA